MTIRQTIDTLKKIELREAPVLNAPPVVDPGFDAIKQGNLDEDLMDRWNSSRESMSEFIDYFIQFKHDLKSDYSNLNDDIHKLSSLVDTITVKLNADSPSHGPAYPDDWQNPA